MKLADIIAKKNGEWFASYIENGGDLSELTDFERQDLAQIVRGSTGARHRQICCQIAYLMGTGLPAATDSGKLTSSPVVVDGNTDDDACTVIAETMGLRPEYVRKIWSKRTEDKTLEMHTAHGKRIAGMYRNGEFDSYPK
jgi:hypothetical protein